MNERRRILIIKPSALGDVIHGLPILHGLRAANPDAHIAWMVRPAFADAVRGHRKLDEVIEFDRRHFGRAWRSPRALGDLAAWLWELGEHRFDTVVDLQGLFRTGFFALVTRARLRAGFARARELGWLFYNTTVRYAGEVHAVDRNYRFAELLGFADVPPTFELPIEPADRASAASLLGEAGRHDREPWAVLAPGSNWGSKRWPSDRFAALADHLADAHGLRVVLVGSPAERDVAAECAAACRAGAIDLAGRTSIRQMMALIEGAAITVSNDSGPMHIAAALDRPLVAVFGPTDPARTGPYGRPDSVVRAVDDHRHHFRHHDDGQIREVTVEMAAATADEQLKRNADD